MKEEPIASIGPFNLMVETTTKGISSIRISKKPLAKGKKANNIVIQFVKAVAEFNKGNGKAFEGLELDAMGTAFQRKVWKAAQAIPYGETRTYAEIAKCIGSPKAVRAVGTALGRNPVCIVVPCHRVVRSRGGIGNYVYGKAMKQWLLEYEAGRTPGKLTKK